MFKRCMVFGFSLLLYVSVASAIELRIQERSGIDRLEEPVTCGVPLAQGWASSVEELVLKIEGQAVPCEFRPVSHWPDGSLRWVHLDFQASVAAGASLALSLEKGTPAPIDSKLDVQEGQDKITVSTGKVRVEILGPNFNLFNSVWLSTSPEAGYTRQLISPHSRGLVMKAGGHTYLSSNDSNSKITVESRGPMRVVVRVEGQLKSTTTAAQGFHYICRLYFYNNSPVVRVAYTFENREPYVEGREDKVTVEALHVEVPTSGMHSSYFLGLAQQDVSAALSAGDEAYLAVESTSQLIYAHNGSQQTVGNPKALKSDRIGWIALDAGDPRQGMGLVGVGLRYFWQMYPTTLEVRADSGLVTAGLIPEKLGTSLDIYSGVARTHYLRFAFLDAADSTHLRSLLAACQKPLVAVGSPEYYCRESRAFGKVNERNPALYPSQYLEVVERVEEEIDKGFESMLAKVDSRTKNGVTWESYGFLNWGDGMHYAWESGVHEAHNIAWNHHYYDLPHMSCLEFVRTGDYRWLDYFLSRSYHLMDVHVTHFSPSNKLNGANRYCPPTDHVRKDPTNSNDYTTAPVYVSPYTNHHKTQGLFDSYYFTGDERSLEVALKAAEFARSFGAYGDYKQPRGAAFQVLTLLATYECTGDTRYLQTARSTFDLWYDYFSSTSTKFFQGYFMVGFLLEAFIDYYEITGDNRVVDFIRQAVDWMHKNRPNDKYSNMALGIGFLAAELADSQYLELEQEYLATWKGLWSNAFKDFALHGRSIARALYYLSYEGLGLEPPPPPPLKGDINKDGRLGIADVIALILKGRRDPGDPEADFDGSGGYSIADVIALLIHIRQQASSAGLAAGHSELKQIFFLNQQQRRMVLDELRKLELTNEEWKKINVLLGLSELPRAFFLGQNHPNPFNPSTTIDYTIPEGEAVHVRLMVYNLRGAVIRTLVDEIKEPGYYSVQWDGTDSRGRKKGSGVYFYRLVTNSYSSVRKMLLVK